MIQGLVYKINQWKTWQRSMLLLMLLLVIYALWYFLLESPLLQRNQSVIVRHTQDQVFVNELHTFLNMQKYFVYQSNLESVQLKQIFQDTLIKVPGLSMTKYTESPAIVLPAGAMLFPRLKTQMNLNLLNGIRRSSATIVLSGGFNDFVAYLNVLQSSSYALYFNSVSFDMNRYPKAEITMTVFKLER